MKIYLDTQNPDFESGKSPKRRCEATCDSFATFAGTCPHCNAKPFRVAGTGKRIAQNDRDYEADAFCIDCKVSVGRIIVETNTLFGLTEDRAVLQGRCRVY